MGAFLLKVEKEFSINCMDFKVGEEIAIENFRNTVFWDITKANTQSIQVEQDAMYADLIKSRNTSLVDKEQAEDFFTGLDFPKFYMKPNQDLTKVFHRRLGREENDDYVNELHDEQVRMVEESHGNLGESYIDPRNIPLHRQALWIAYPIGKRPCDEGWGGDLKDLNGIYAVVLSKRAMEAVGGVLTNHTFSFEIVELDDRYRFILKYDQIIGNRWMFENFKGEQWNTQI